MASSKQRAAAFQTVLLDLQNVGEYVASQLAAKRSEENVLSVQADALQKRMRKTLTALDMSQGQRLTEAIRKGPWTPEQKSSLAGVVDALVATCGRTTRRALQTLPCPENALLAVEWASIRCPQTLRQAKIAQMAGRFWTLGLTCPSEPTSFKIAAIICICDHIADASEQESVFLDVKKAIKKLDGLRTYPYEHRVEYPEDLETLPAEVFKYAYPDGLKPIKMNLPELTSVMGGAQQRGANKKVKSQNEKALLKGLKILKEKAADVGFDISVNSSQERLSAAQAQLSAGLGGSTPQRALCDDSSSQSQGDQDSPPDAQAATRGVSKATLSRLASTSMLAFKPQLALPSAGAGVPGHTDADAGQGDAVTAVDRMIAEAQAGGAPVTKRPACKDAATQPAACKKRRLACKRPAAALLVEHALVLGCSKCRGAVKGCAKCKDPNFNGKRGPGCAKVKDPKFKA